MDNATTAQATPSERPAILSDVFGASRDLPLAYFERSRLDAQIRYYLSQGRHLIVYGGSSQGKSSLVRKHLASASYIEVQSAPSMKRYDLYRLLLREAGVYVSLGRKKKRTKGVSAEVTLYREDTGAESETDEQTISIDLSNVNDILRILRDNGFSKTIVLDDFHLLSGKIQRQIAADLKTLYERSRLQVIVIGVWREADKLSALSGYLPGRSNSITVDAWSAEELEAVIKLGGALLKVVFGPELVSRIIELSAQNIGVLQQVCQRVCQSAEIAWAQEHPVTLADPALADQALRMLVESTAGRYRLFLERYARRRPFGSEHISKWIVHAILNRSMAALDEGVTAAEIVDHINRCHLGREEITVEVADGASTIQYRPYRGRIDPTVVLKALSKIERYQRKRDINPVILSYDKRRETLRAVDVGFLLFLRSSNREELLNRLPRYDDELDEEGIARALRSELDTRIATDEAPAAASPATPPPGAQPALVVATGRASRRPGRTAKPRSRPRRRSPRRARGSGR